MLKFKVTALIAAACCSGLAHANWGLKFEVWNGAAWVFNVNAVAGDVVKFRVGTYFDIGTLVTTPDGTGAAAELFTFTGSNQFTNFSRDKDLIQNLLREIGPGTPALLTNTGNGTIGTSQATSSGSNIRRGPLPADPIPYTTLYGGEIIIGDGTPRVLVWQNKTFGVAPNTKGATFFNYGSPNNRITGAPDTAKTDITASINVIPAPSSLALIGLGGLVAAHRRRV